MLRTVISVAALTLLCLSFAAAQEALPKLDVQCDGSSVVIHNQSEGTVLLKNLSLVWEERSEAWWEFNPENDFALKGDESRKIGYDEIVRNYDPERDQGLPGVIMLGVKAESPYPALLEYKRGENESYALIESMSRYINPTELKKEMEESKGR